MASFAHAPISKFLTFITASTTVLSSVFTLKQILFFGFKDNINNQQALEFKLWQLVSNHFVFLSSSDLIFGIALIYTFRLFERQMGSKKYGVFIVEMLIVGTILEVIFILLSIYFFGPPGFVFCGPHVLIFAQLVQYYYDVPPTAPISFFGLNLNDKIFTYVMAFNILLSHAPSSVYHAFCGIFAGLLYRVDYLKLDTLSFPDSINQLCSKYALPLLSTSPLEIGNRVSGVIRNDAQLRTNNTTPDRVPVNMFDFESGTFYNSPEPLRQPSIQNIQTLVHMGIDRETALQVLTRYNDDIQLALDSLYDNY